MGTIIRIGIMRWTWMRGVGIKNGFPKKYQKILFTHFKIYNLMFPLIIALLLQLGTISSASDFKHSEYNEQSSSYQGQSIIIKDEIVY